MYIYHVDMYHLEMLFGFFIGLLGSCMDFGSSRRLLFSNPG